MLAEDSTTMNIVGNDPTGQNLVKYLHQNLHLYHLQDYVKVDPLPNMRSIKESGNWVLFKGAKGWAAIKPLGDSYTVVGMGNDGKTHEMTTSRVAEVNGIIRMTAGKIVSTWMSSSKVNVAANTKAAREKNRQDLAKTSNKVSYETLVERLRPLLVKYLTTAEAELRGMMGNLMKAGRYNSRAQKTMRRLQFLQQYREQLAAGGEVHSNVANVIRKAAKLAATHYYPDLAGDFTNNHGGDLMVSQRAVDQLFTDINAGDTKKLAGIMAYVKRELMGIGQ